MLINVKLLQSKGKESNFPTGELSHRLEKFVAEEAAHERHFREHQFLLDEKHAAGKELAHGAVGYLFGENDKFEIDFAVGAVDVTKATEQQQLHEGFAAHLGFLCKNGAITEESLGSFVACVNDRVIVRTEADHDADGLPGVLSYRDSNTQRAIEISTNDSNV